VIMLGIITLEHQAQKKHDVSYNENASDQDKSMSLPKSAKVSGLSSPLM